MKNASRLLLLLAFTTTAQAQTPSVNGTEGARKLVESQCAECHSRVLKGEPTLMYTRSDRRAQNAEALAKQVHVCGSQLKVPLFPEEEEHLATYLNRQFYQFKQ